MGADSLWPPRGGEVKEEGRAHPRHAQWARCIGVGSSSDKGRHARSTHAYTFPALARRAQTKEKRLSQRTQVRRASYPVDTDPVRGPTDLAVGVPETDAQTVG